MLKQNVWQLAPVHQPIYKPTCRVKFVSDFFLYRDNAEIVNPSSNRCIK